MYYGSFYLMSFSINAEEGRLMDSYPPNVSAENFTLPDLNGTGTSVRRISW